MLLRRVEHALAPVPEPHASRGEQSEEQQRQRHEDRGGDQQDNERHNEHPPSVVESPVECQPFASGVRITEHSDFHFGGARLF